MFGGGGGSSFISGHEGCNAILGNSTENNIEMSNQSIHYLGYRFFHTDMIDGNSLMPSPEGNKETGHCTYGAIRIHSVKEVTCDCHVPFNMLRSIFCMVSIYLTI